MTTVWTSLIFAGAPELNKFLLLAIGVVTFLLMRATMLKAQASSINRPRWHMAVAIIGVPVIVVLALAMPMYAFLSFSRLSPSKKVPTEELAKLYLTDFKKGKYEDTQKILAPKGQALREFNELVRRWKKLDSKAAPILAWSEPTVTYGNMLGGTMSTLEYTLKKRTSNAKAIFKIESSFETGNAIRDVQFIDATLPTTAVPANNSDRSGPNGY